MWFYHSQQSNQIKNFCENIFIIKKYFININLKLSLIFIFSWSIVTSSFLIFFLNEFLKIDLFNISIVGVVIQTSSVIDVIVHHQIL